MDQGIDSMEQKVKRMDPTIKVTISLKANEKLESLLSVIKEKEKTAKVTKQKLLELAISKLTEEDVLSLAKSCKDLKAIVLGYLKEDKNLSDPKSLISLLEQEVSLKRE